LIQLRAEVFWYRLVTLAKIAFQAWERRREGSWTFPAGGNSRSPAQCHYGELLQRIAASGAKPEDSLPTAVELSNVHRSPTALHRWNGEAGKADAVNAPRLQLWRGWNQTLPNNALVRRQMDVTR
jgi:hypothetical protein